MFLFKPHSVINENIKSPLNYIGGKSKILHQITSLFPKDINNFIDLFAGGCNVGINVDANQIWFNDNLSYLIEMYKIFQLNKIEETINHIENRIEQFSLSLTNKEGYQKMRKLYNEEKHPLDLFVLVAYSFNHQIRFNNNHEFNNPFGKERSSFNIKMKNNLKLFLIALKNKIVNFSNLEFQNFNFSSLSSNDFVYCDPPYLITKGTYNDGKRGFTGWAEKEEILLLKILDQLNENHIPFALSNVLKHKGRQNNILEKWYKNNANYQIHYINSNYSNSNYQTYTRSEDKNIEVLITNYEIYW